MTLVFPTYTVEVAFDAGVNTPAASRTWTDVSAYVEYAEELQIQFGANGWRSIADPNSLSLTLNNRDGRFTAGLSSSPYYPNVKLGRPIRVTATLDGVDYVRFVGFVDQWPVEWPGGSDAYSAARITATSRTAWLGTRVEMLSIVEEAILDDSPTAYYTLGEPEGSTQANDSSGNNLSPLAHVGTGADVVFGTATGPGTDGLTAATFAGGRFLATTALMPVTGEWTLEAFFLRNGAPANIEDVAKAGTGFHVDVNGKVGLAPTSFVSTTTVTDGAVHHAAMTMDSAGNIELFVDGVSEATDTRSLFSDDEPLRVGGTLSDPGLVGNVAHVAFHPSVLDAEAIAKHAAAGLTGFAGETPAERITRYAAFAGIADTELDLEDGMVADLSHIDTTGKTALECMRLVEATEEGWLFDAQDGTLTFHARNHRYTEPVAFTATAELEQIDEGVTPRLDRSVLRNDVSAQTSDQAVTARVQDADSIEDYGHARESLDLHTADPDEPLLHASWLVNQFGEPRNRIPQLGLQLQNNLVVPFGEGPFGTGAFGSSVADQLQMTIGTRIAIEGMPGQAATPSQDYFVEGYTETIGLGYHNFSVNVTEADPYDVWTVGDPVLGAWDETPLAY